MAPINLRFSFGRPFTGMVVTKERLLALRPLEADLELPMRGGYLSKAGHQQPLFSNTRLRSNLARRIARFCHLGLWNSWNLCSQIRHTVSVVSP